MARHKKILRKLKAKLLSPWLIFLLVVVFILVGVLFFTPKPNIKLDESSVAQVYVNKDNLSQADTLLVVVKNEPDQITGALGLVPLRFFRNKNNKDWVGIIGIPVDKKPGTYALVVSDSKRELIKKDITIVKRNFPVTSLIISPSLAQQGYTAKKIVTTIVSKENKELHNVLGIITKNSYITKPFIYPLSAIKVVGDFGDIRASSPYQIQHLGTDLRAPSGTKVFAVNDGKVVFEKMMPDYGNTIIIDHGLGMYSLYLHLSKFMVSYGQMVKQQDVIALSGATGYAIGPHLHFSIKVRGAALDPLIFIKTTQESW